MAVAINATGKIAGWSLKPGDSKEAVLWTSP
jgi:hypothetical protein